MNKKKKRLEKIDTLGFIPQEMFYHCPECNYELIGAGHDLTLSLEGIIGYGYYEINYFRGATTDKEPLGLCFECPICFTKSVCHITTKILNRIQDQIDGRYEEIKNDF